MAYLFYIDNTMANSLLTQTPEPMCWLNLSGKVCYVMINVILAVSEYTFFLKNQRAPQI